MVRRIIAINEHLQRIGSGFRVLEDGRTLARRVNGVWLVKGFGSIEEMETFVFALKGGRT